MIKRVQFTQTAPLYPSNIHRLLIPLQPAPLLVYLTLLNAGGLNIYYFMLVPVKDLTSSQENPALWAPECHSETPRFTRCLLTPPIPAIKNVERSTTPHTTRRATSYLWHVETGPELCAVCTTLPPLSALWIEACFQLLWSIWTSNLEERRNSGHIPPQTTGALERNVQ